MRYELAPLGRIFVSVECESTRVGEITGFVHVADGVMREASEAWKELSRIAHNQCFGPLHRVVLDTCEAVYYDWSTFAVNFLIESTHPRPIIVETRGERRFRPLNASLYLHLTPSMTVLTPHDLRAGDEVKMLINEPGDIPEAIERLKPFAEAGYPAFVLPRVGADLNRARDCFRKFLAVNSTSIRMMTIGHEMIGVD